MRRASNLNPNINRKLYMDFPKPNDEAYSGLYNKTVLIKVHGAAGKKKFSREKVEATFLLKPLKIKGKCWIYIYIIRKDHERAQYLMDRKAMCWERAWKKKWAPWRNTTIPVHPSTNNSTIISILILLLQPNTALKPPEAEESEGKERVYVGLWKKKVIYINVESDKEVFFFFF